MAMTPKSVTSSLSTGTASVRQAALSRTLSAHQGSAVEETSTQVGVSFDTAMLFQHHEGAGDKKDDSSKGKSLVEYAGSSETFANILEEASLSSGTRDKSERSARRGFSDYVNRAINIYETNARVIHGLGPEPRGSTLSLTL